MKQDNTLAFYLPKINEDERKALILLIDVLSMEFLPKKVILEKEVNQNKPWNTKNTTKIVFTSRKPLIDIEYKPDIIWEEAKRLGFNFNFLDVKYYTNAYNRKLIIRKQLKTRRNNYLRTV